jgi:hypothetical protein
MTDDDVDEVVSAVTEVAATMAREPVGLAD